MAYLQMKHLTRIAVKSVCSVWTCKMTEEEIVELSKRIARDAESISFNKQMEEYFGDSIFEFTYITRRKLAEYFDTCPNFEGKMKLDELLQGIWDMNEPCTRDEDLFIFDRMTLGEYIIKHVVINDDMSYKDMLLDILQIKYISDNSIIKFLEKWLIQKLGQVRNKLNM